MKNRKVLGTDCLDAPQGKAAGMGLALGPEALEFPASLKGDW